MTSKQPTPMPAGMSREDRPKAPSAPPAKFKEGGMRGNVKNTTDSPRCAPPKSSSVNINLEIETTLLEDGSFWYRMKEIRGSKAGEWNEWVLLERSRDNEL